MQYLVDTHIFVWYARERYKLSRDVALFMDNYENTPCISGESLKELVQLWNKKPHFRRWWKTPLELLRSVEDIYGFRVLYLHKEHYETYAKLQINESQDHNDPSDHLIISQAITNRMPLISADTRFPFYVKQGLDLIGNN